MTLESWSNLIADAQDKADDRVYPDRAIMRRIIEGRGRSTGKLYGYASKQEEPTHLVAFKREVAR